MPANTSTREPAWRRGTLVVGVAVCAIILGFVPGSSFTGGDGTLGQTHSDLTHFAHSSLDRPRSIGCPPGNCSQSGNSSGPQVNNSTPSSAPPGGPAFSNATYVAWNRSNSAAGGNSTTNAFLPGSVSASGSANPPVRSRLGPDVVRPSVATKWWAGLQYNGTNYTSSHSVQLAYSSIFIPDAEPWGSQTYVNLLSMFDNKGYYDQIGIGAWQCSPGCDTYDRWDIVWEQGTGTNTPPYACGTTGSWGWVNTASGLNEYSWYTFEMYLNHDSQLIFRVFNGSGNFNGTPFWTSAPLADTATTFETAPTYGNCHGGPSGQAWWDLTVYEEADDFPTTTTLPPWDFWYNQTTVAWYGSSWVYAGIRDSAFSLLCSSCPNPPHGYNVATYSAPTYALQDVIIANVAEWIWYPTNTYYTTPGGGWFTANGQVLAIGNACSGTTCGLSMSCPSTVSPSGGSWNTGCLWSSYVPTTSMDWQGSAGSTTPLGFYWVGEIATITSYTPNEWTTFMFNIWVT
jgi:hypothetical protein